MPSAVHAWVDGTRSVRTTLHTHLSRRNPPTREYILKLTPMVWFPNRTYSTHNLNFQTIPQQILRSRSKSYLHQHV